MKKVLCVILSVFLLLNVSGLSVIATAAKSPKYEKVVSSSYTVIQNETKSKTVKNPKNGKKSKIKYTTVVKHKYEIAIYKMKISQKTRFNTTTYTYKLKLETLKDGKIVKSYESKNLTINKKSWNDLSALLGKDKKITKAKIQTKVTELQGAASLYSELKKYNIEKDADTIRNYVLPAFCNAKIKKGYNGKETVLLELEEKANLSSAFETSIKDLFNIDTPAKDFSESANSLFGWTNKIIDVIFSFYSDITAYERMFAATTINKSNWTKALDCLKTEVDRKAAIVYEAINTIK